MYINEDQLYDGYMPYAEPPSVTTVADARTGLSAMLRNFRADPDSAPAVTIGSHRRPEAVLVPFDRFRALSTAPAPSLTRVLQLLRDQSALIHRIASLSNIDSVAVFGSVARGTETETSDIDLLVAPSTGASLFDLAQFEIDMGELTSREVDVVSRRALDPVRDKSILLEAIEL
jgi:predicted nucleotidyltransferase